MRLVSVNTGLPREVTWHGRIVTTAIFKERVEGRVTLHKLNLDADFQADQRVHGERIRRFTAIRSKTATTGKKNCRAGSCRRVVSEKTSLQMALLEDSVRFGEEFPIGSARVVVT